MTKPLLASSPTIQLEVDTDRKLRGDAVVSPVAWNALRLRSDGLYVRTFQPVGALVQQTVAAVNQSLPIYGNVAVPSASTISYTQAIADNGLARAGAAMWSALTPTRLTCVRTARYLVSAHGRYKSVGTYTSFTAGFWIAKNGDEQQFLGGYLEGQGPGADPGALAAPLGQGSGVSQEQWSGAYHILNEVTLTAGDYIEVKCVFVSSAAAPANTITTGTVATPLSGIPCQTMALVQVGEV